MIALLLASRLLLPPRLPQVRPGPPPPPCSASVAPGALCVWQAPNVYLYERPSAAPSQRPAWVYVSDSTPDRIDAHDSQTLYLLELWSLHNCNPADAPELREAGAILPCLGYGADAGRKD